MLGLGRGDTQLQDGAITATRRGTTVAANLARGPDTDGPQSLGHLGGLLLVQDPTKDPTRSDVGQPEALGPP